MSPTMLRAVILLACVLTPCLPALGEDADVARTVAMDVCEKVRSSPNAPDSWADAAVADVQSIESPKGSWRLARLAKDGQDAGYILLGETAGGLVPAMYSASAPPLELVKHLAAPVGEGAFTAAPQIGSVPDVSMVAIPTLRNDRLLVTPLACSVAGMCVWVQERHRIPLLYLAQDVFPAEPLDLDSPLVVPSPPPEIGELTKYLQARAKIFSDPELFGPAPPPTDTQSAFAPPPELVRVLRDPSLRVDLAERMRSLIQAELLKDLSRQARWKMMQEEYIHAAAPLLPEPVSFRFGTASAIVIQSYLWDAASPEQGLEAFARAHGLQSVWLYSDLTGLAFEKLPCVLLGPEHQAVLAVGLTRDSGAEYAVVVVPQTVRSLERPKKEVVAENVAKIRAIQAAGGPDAAKLSPTLHTPEIDRKVDEALQKGTSPNLQGTTKWDAKTTVPAAFGQGAHVARLDLFRGWKVLTVALPDK